MSDLYSFSALSSSQEAAALKTEWLNSLSHPQDGMWNSFRDAAAHWGIYTADKMIGYFCLNDEQQLLQYYISADLLSESKAIFKQILEQHKVQQGIVGTNNPIYLSAALHAAQNVDIHSYLFQDLQTVELYAPPGELKAAHTEDIERIVDFCHYSVGAPKSWLNGYISDLASRGEVFVLEDGENIIGTCEVRGSQSQEDYADIGMIVSPDYRRRGYGAYLLNRAKRIARDRGKTPICSCEKGNTGSLKSIHKNGFASLHQLLAITFASSDQPV